jgi:hypothetical protein
VLLSCLFQGIPHFLECGDKRSAAPHSKFWTHGKQANNSLMGLGAHSYSFLLDMPAFNRYYEMRFTNLIVKECGYKA